MIEPKLEHYPEWLRDMIKQRYAFGIPGISDHKSADEDLREIHSHYRTDPISSVVFELFLDSVRKRFNFYYLQKKVNEQQEEIAVLYDEIKSLKQKIEILDRRDHTGD